MCSGFILISDLLKIHKKEMIFDLRKVIIHWNFNKKQVSESNSIKEGLFNTYLLPIIAKLIENLHIFIKYS